jgi:hypothetical protein
MKAEIIENLIEKSIVKVDDKTLYRAEVISEINQLGVKLAFTNEGVRWYE